MEGSSERFNKEKKPKTKKTKKNKKKLPRHHPIFSFIPYPEGSTDQKFSGNFFSRKWTNGTKCGQEILLSFPVNRKPPFENIDQ